MTNTDIGKIISPDQISGALHTVAQKMREDAVDLAEAWQDPNAGRVWAKIADILDRAANQSDTACDKYFR